ncbi:MAG: hypothetical protein SO044_00155 [Agathobaculum sp.]|uniref:hypothetical protein n=1 Tax=Agathobaculum sp. TaxID=2048138 RepID=UPI002A7F7254|nr:hypothetical protein [Agathobaculum sp.]MDY3710822.1 hypothetical protein [Agathobaculum sp.]
MTYICVISSGSTYAEYEVSTRSAYKAACQFGRGEHGEQVSIYKGDKLISRAAWDCEQRHYYRCCI